MESLDYKDMKKCDSKVMDRQIKNHLGYINNSLRPQTINSRVPK